MRYLETFLGSAIFIQKYISDWTWLEFSADDIQQAMGPSFLIDRFNLNILAKQIVAQGNLICGVETFINSENMQSVTFYLIISRDKISYIKGRQAVNQRVMDQTNGVTIDNIIIDHDRT